MDQLGLRMIVLFYLRRSLGSILFPQCWIRVTQAVGVVIQHEQNEPPVIGSAYGDA